MTLSEAREEINGDVLRTLRPFLISAYKQLGEMLEAPNDRNTITANLN